MGLKEYLGLVGGVGRHFRPPGGLLWLAVCGGCLRVHEAACLL
jgi:hypothetical protein